MTSGNWFKIYILCVDPEPYLSGNGTREGVEMFINEVNYPELDNPAAEVDKYMDLIFNARRLWWVLCKNFCYSLKIDGGSAAWHGYCLAINSLV